MAFQKVIGVPQDSSKCTPMGSQRKAQKSLRGTGLGRHWPNPLGLLVSPVILQSPPVKLVAPRMGGERRKSSWENSTQMSQLLWELRMSCTGLGPRPAGGNRPFEEV